MKIHELLLSLTFIIVGIVSPSLAQDTFEVNYLAADKTTTITEVEFDKTFYIKITYPADFQRTPFNLHELNFLSGDSERRYTFWTVQIPYSIESETDESIIVSCTFENDEDIQATLKMMEGRFAFDENGNLILGGSLSNSSTSLPTGSNQLVLKIK